MCRSSMQFPCMFNMFMFMFRKYSLIFTRVRYVRKYVSSFIRSSCLSFLSKSIFWCEVWLHTLSRKCVRDRVGSRFNHVELIEFRLSESLSVHTNLSCVSSSSATTTHHQGHGLGEAWGRCWLQGDAWSSRDGYGRRESGRTAVEVDACKQYRSYCTEWLAGRVRWKNGIKLRHILRHVYHLAIS